MRTRRAKREFDYTFKKNRVGAYFRILENKKRMCQYRRSAKIDPSPSPLEGAHIRFDKKYVQTMRQEIKSTEN